MSCSGEMAPVHADVINVTKQAIKPVADFVGPQRTLAEV